MGDYRIKINNVDIVKANAQFMSATEGLRKLSSSAASALAALEELSYAFSGLRVKPFRIEPYAFQTIRESGISASIAGQNLRKVISRLTKLNPPSKKKSVGKKRY